MMTALYTSQAEQTEVGKTYPSRPPTPSGGHPSLIKIGKGFIVHIFNRIVFEIQVGRETHPFPFIVREGPSGHRTGAGGWVTNTPQYQDSTIIFKNKPEFENQSPSLFCLSGKGRPARLEGAYPACQRLGGFFSHYPSSGVRQLLIPLPVPSFRNGDELDGEVKDKGIFFQALFASYFL
jgi:hypothetical protein